MTVFFRPIEALGFVLCVSPYSFTGDPGLFEEGIGILLFAA